MKLSWKIFFSTLVITILTFSIGGYLLIHSTFRTALVRETNAAKEENKMIRNYFKAVLPAVTENKEAANAVFKSVISNFSSDITIRLLDENLNKVIESENITGDIELYERADDNSLLYTVTLSDSRYYIQSVSVIYAFEKKYIIESYRNISNLYSDRKQLFSIYQRIMIIMLLINGVFVFVMTRWTIAPIRSLSKTTRKIAQGKYENRAFVRSKDEVGMLAKDFNQMADSLEKKIHDLETVNLRQQDFIGSFAHELKTPLTSIIGYADMLRSRKMSDENKILAADYIFSEGKRLESLSLKLLELLVVRNLDFEMVLVSMRSLFEDVKKIMLPILKEDDIILEIKAEDTFLRIEPDLIKTVILNLLDNSRKAISDKGKITLTGKCISECRFLITVTDTGKGIPESELERITEAFYMVDKSRARARGGAGLGLALCQEIVELHNGEMEFESEPDKGTTVHLILYDREDKK